VTFRTCGGQADTHLAVGQLEAMDDAAFVGEGVVGERRSGLTTQLAFAVGEHIEVVADQLGEQVWGPAAPVEHHRGTPATHQLFELREQPADLCGGRR
jgi:hypothetical protein